MSNMLARLSAWFGGGGGTEEDNGGGCRAYYGVVVSFVSVLLFCVLVATISVWKAFVFAGVALFAFGVFECLAPESWRGRSGAGAEREVTPVAAMATACRFGLAKAAVHALPTFPYASIAAAEAAGDLECGSGELCSVCLEDLQAGEMVRQLPTCKHLFHVECIDMWLHSHRTCPICRCDLSPPLTVTTKVAEIQLPAGDALPPVVGIR